MTRRRVVVTGLGIISPVGIGVAESWDAILAARSGSAHHPLRRLDISVADRR
jgi:3-oxoacyl-(acyl-carrier-protein) synthase